MRAEQQFDLIAESGWAICVDIFGTPCNMMPGGGLCLRHEYTDEHDLMRAHYDTPYGTTAIPVRGCVKYENQYIYED